MIQGYQLDLYNLYTGKPAKKECPKSLVLKGYHTKECQDTTNYTSKNEEAEAKSPVMKIIATLHQ
jgi:hypothetical protein